MSLENCGTLYNQMLFICAEWGLCMQAFWDPMQCCLQPPCASLLLGNCTYALSLGRRGTLYNRSLLYFLNVGTVHAGILGAHAVLFATSLCIIIVDLIEGTDVFTQWYTYLVS